MSVGLNSNIKESDFTRKKLNLVLAIDISDSMSSNMWNYYHNKHQTDASKINQKKTKQELALEIASDIISQLNDDDRLAIILFDHNSYLAKPFNFIRSTNITAIKENLMKVTPKGGTNFEAAYKNATLLWDNLYVNETEYSNRIMVLTDAMPTEKNCFFVCFLSVMTHKQKLFQPFA